MPARSQIAAGQHTAYLATLSDPTILAGRGVGEGAYDASRQANGAVKPGDVQAAGNGKAV